MTHKFGRECQTSQDIFATEGGIFVEHILDRIPSRKELQDRPRRDPRASQGRLTIADIGINNDATHDRMLPAEPARGNVCEFLLWIECVVPCLAWGVARGLTPIQPSTRWKNQKPPAVTTAKASAATVRSPASLLRRCTRTRSGATTATMHTWPNFDAAIEGEERPAKRLPRERHLSRDVGEAKAVHESEAKREKYARIACFPSEQSMHADENDAERDQRFDQARRRINESKRGQCENQIYSERRGVSHLLDASLLLACARNSHSSNARPTGGSTLIRSGI